MPPSGSSMNTDQEWLPYIGGIGAVHIAGVHVAIDALDTGHGQNIRHPYAAGTAGDIVAPMIGIRKPPI